MKRGSEVFSFDTMRKRGKSLTFAALLFFHPSSFPLFLKFTPSHGCVIVHVNMVQQKNLEVLFQSVNTEFMGWSSL